MGPSICFYINLGWLIVHNKGSQVRIFKLWYYVPEHCFNLNSVNTDEMLQILSRSSLFAKVPILGFPYIQNKDVSNK